MIATRLFKKLHEDGLVSDASFEKIKAEHTAAYYLYNGK
jgi:hypothetical protein